jgi:hypothetical protein
MPLIRFKLTPTAGYGGGELQTVGYTRYTQPRVNRWKIKYVGWAGTTTACLKVTIPFFNDSSHIQSFTDDDASLATPSDADSSPSFYFYCNSHQVSAAATISYYGSLPMDLTVGRIQSHQHYINVYVQGFDSLGAVSEIRTCDIVLEYE